MIEFLEIGEVDIRSGNFRIKPDGLQIALFRLLQLAEALEHVAHFVIGIRKIRLERERRLDAC